MKYVLFSILALFLIISGCLSSKVDRIALQGGEDEIVEGTGTGYRGPIHARLRMKGGIIMEIEVDFIEDRFVGGAAIEELIDMIIEYNSTDVDVVTGATETSKGFLSAVESAIMTIRK